MPDYTRQPAREVAAGDTDFLTNSTHTTAHLLSACVLHNLSAEVAGLDGAQVLLVALTIAGILVQHVRCACLGLRL